MQNGMPDTTGMNSAQIGNLALQQYNSPDLSSAQNAVQQAQGNYSSQLGDNATLPQLLNNSLNASLGNTQDPQREADLAAILKGVQNPSGAISDAEGITLPQAELNNQPGLIGPGAQSDAMAEKLGNAGARLSADNEMLGARGMGIAGILGTYSNYMANKTQQLLAQVQQAQSNRDYLWNKAQTLGGMAFNISQLKQSAEQFQQNLDFQKQTNPLLQAKAGRQEAITSMGKYKSFDAWYAAYHDDPRLQGMSKEDLFQDWQKGGGKGTISGGLQRQTGILTGDPIRDLLNTGTAEGLPGKVIQSGESFLPLGIMALLSKFL